jgi:hypothetical protein
MTPRVRFVGMPGASVVVRFSDKLRTGLPVLVQFALTIMEH